MKKYHFIKKYNKMIIIDRTVIPYMSEQKLKIETWNNEFNMWKNYKNNDIIFNTTSDILYRKIHKIINTYPKYNWLLLKCLKETIFKCDKITWPKVSKKIWKMFRHTDMFYNDLIHNTVKLFYHKLQIILWTPIIRQAVIHRLYSYPNGLRIPEIRQRFKNNIKE